jgi:subtilisin-like proprotein convertase family protein
MRKKSWVAALGVLALAGSAFAQPVNDLCADALPVACGDIVPGTTVGGGVDNDAPFCGVGPTSPGVWYSLEGTGGDITVSLCPDEGGNATYDSKLTVYSGTCQALVCIGGNDDACGLSSRVDFFSNAGETYLILVHGFGGASGDFDLAVVCDAVFDDCNGNGVPDDEDITNGTSTDCNGNGIPDECEFDQVTYDFPVNIAIPDDDPNGISDTQTINDSAILADVNIGVVINHTFLGDLIIDVEHNAITVRLWDRQCGTEENMDVIFDDEGIPVICSTPTQGSFRPVQPLSAYDGQDLFGNWTLTVSDNAGLDLGTLVSWSVVAGIPQPVCCQGTLVSSDTIPDGGIDAREEHEFCNPQNLTGLSSFVFTFDDSSTVVDSCFDVVETGGNAPPNIVGVVQLGGNQVRLDLDRPITAGEWTTVGYNGVFTQSLVDIGFLPGDVNQSGKVTGADITELIDCLNNQIFCADYQTDIDRSGLTNGNDITRLIDVLQDPVCDPFPWLNEELVDEPNP